MKQFSRLAIVIFSIILLVTSVAAAPMAQQPNVTFTLVKGIPATMQVGQSYTVIVQVKSDVPFVFSAMLPKTYYPGARYILAGQGDHSQGGTSTTLRVTFTALGSTVQLPNGVAPISVVAGARFQSGYTASQQFDFLVAVP